MRKKLPSVIVLLMALAPLFFWYSMAPLAPRFSNYTSVARSLGQILALVGIVLFSINFILSARFKFIDRISGGLNFVYIKHHKLGGLALILILFHPLALAVQYMFISPPLALRFLMLDFSLDLLVGKVALLAMLILLGITFYLSWKYENWKLSHKFLGLPFALVGIHILLVSSDISRNGPLRYYIFAVFCLGIFSYLWRTIFQVHRVLDYSYIVNRLVSVNNRVFEVLLTADGKRIQYLPGQFAFINIKYDGLKSESHPFSITSSPSGETLSFGIKALGDYTQSMMIVKTGATAKIEGPFGSFSYLLGQSKEQLWIAGGIGITPFLSMIRHMAANPQIASGYKVDMYYVIKNREEAAFADELSALAPGIPGLVLNYYFSEESGMFDAGKVNLRRGNQSYGDIFICGPPPMMASLRRQFTARGFRNKSIHSEEFSL